MICCRTILPQFFFFFLLVFISTETHTQIINHKINTSNIEKHLQYHFELEGGGTSCGISSLINNEIDITATSRLLIPSEVQTLAKYYRSLGMYFLIDKSKMQSAMEE